MRRRTISTGRRPPRVTKTTGTKIAGVTSPYLHTGLAAGTKYYYIVTAVNSAGEGEASDEVSATTTSAPAPTPTVPAAPTGVIATGGTKQVTISWPAVTGATSYNLYWSATAGVTKTTGTKIAGADEPHGSKRPYRHHHLLLHRHRGEQRRRGRPVGSGCRDHACLYAGLRPCLPRRPG